MKSKYIILFGITLLLILGSIKYNPQIRTNEIKNDIISTNSIIETYQYYNVTFSSIIIGSESGSYTDTFLKDLTAHTIDEADIGGYKLEIMYGINLTSLNPTDTILRFEIEIYLTLNLGLFDTINIMLWNNTDSSKYLLTTDPVSPYHWKNITFSPPDPTDFIDESSNNLVRLYFNDSIGSVDISSDDISIDFIKFIVVSTNTIAPSFISYPSDISYEQSFQANASWIVEEETPDTYKIYRNSSLVQSGSYTNGTTIICDLNTTEAGIWNYTMFVNDTYNNNNSISFLLTVDPQMSPSLLLSPPDREYLKDSVNSLIWRVNEKYPDKYVIYRNDTPIDNGSYINNTDISHLINTSSLGIFQYKLFVNDTLNNTLEDTVIVQIVQNVTPYFIDYPSDMDIEQDYPSLSIRWVIQDDNPDKYELSKNGSIIQNGMYESDVEIIHIANTTVTGMWNYTMFVNDTYNNNNSVSFLLTIDPKQNPELLSQPNNNIKCEIGSESNLTWQINEKYPDKYVIYRNNSLEENGSYTNATDIFILINTTSIGVFQYRLFANDTSNNSVEDIVIVNIVEYIPPNFTSFPSDLECEQYLQINISWIIAENNPEWYEIYRNGTLIQNGSYINGIAIICNLNTTVINIWEYTIFVNDTFGNNNSKSFLLTIDPKRDPELLSYPSSNIEYEINSSNYLIWQINEKYPDTYLIYINNSLVKSGSYTNASDIFILVNTSNIGTFQYRLLVNDTSNNVVEHIVTITIVDTSLDGSDWLLFVIFGVIIGLIGVISTVVYTKTKKRRITGQDNLLKEKIKTYREFIDLNNVYQVFIIHQVSGLTIANAIFKQKHNVEQDLIGGFLSAISSFGAEMNGGALKKIDYEGFKAYMHSTNFIKLVVFLLEEPSIEFMSKIVGFVHHYELLHREDIINFAGNIMPFKDLVKEVGEYLSMERIQEYKLEIPLKISKLTPLQKHITGVCSVHTKPQKMEVFLNLCIDKLKKPAYEIYEEIIRLKKMDIFVHTE